MALSLFGFSFDRQQKETSKIQTFAPPSVTDDLGSAKIVGTNSFIGTQNIQHQGASLESTENQYIMQYRQLALIPTVDTAIEEIVSEAIISDEIEDSVKIDLADSNLSDPIKSKVRKSFKKVLNLLDFKTKGYDIFRRWYIDGRLNYHIIIDESNPKSGIQEIRYIDPKKLKRIREIIPTNKNTQSVNPNSYTYESKVIEYYIYNENGVDTGNALLAQGIRISKDSIVHTNSGLTDPSNKIVIGFLHKSIADANKLNTLENSMVIFRLVRAPERRIFYVDVGNLPKARAEQYMYSVMQKYKTKLTYDTVSGKVRDDRNIMSLTEDYWIPRQGGSKSTEIGTLQGTQSNGTTDEVEYFRKKLMQSLNVPYSRLAGDSVFSMGRSGEINRDEARFAKFISRLRTKFNQLFDELMKRELVLAQVMSLEEWEYIKKDVKYEYLKDNYFTELLEADMLANRVGVLAQVEPYVGTYFSKEYVWKSILKMTDEEIANEKQRIKDEMEEDPTVHTPVDQIHQLNTQAQMNDLEIDKATQLSKLPPQGQTPNPFK